MATKCFYYRKQCNTIRLIRVLHLQLRFRQISSQSKFCYDVQIFNFRVNFEFWKCRPRSVQHSKMWPGLTFLTILIMQNTFDCGTDDICIHASLWRDCYADCKDGSDEGTVEWRDHGDILLQHASLAMSCAMVARAPWRNERSWTVWNIIHFSVGWCNLSINYLFIQKLTQNCAANVHLRCRHRKCLSVTMATAFFSNSPIMWSMTAVIGRTKVSSDWTSVSTDQHFTNHLNKTNGMQTSASLASVGASQHWASVGLV